MTTPSSPAFTISVSGGVGGIEVQYEDLAAMGRLTDEVAENILFIATTSQQYLANPSVIASAVLDPSAPPGSKPACSRHWTGPRD